MEKDSREGRKPDPSHVRGTKSRRIAKSKYLSTGQGGRQSSQLQPAEPHSCESKDNSNHANS